MKTDAPVDAAFVGKHLLNPTPDPKTVMVPFTPPPLSQAQTWRHAVAFDHCRVLLPQFVFAQHDDVLSRLYQLSLDEGEPRTQPGSFARFWASLAYPLVALRQAWIYYRRTGSFVKKKYGVSTFRQFRDLWYCAWKQNQSPRHYYWRKLYLVPDRRDWHVRQDGRAAVPPDGAAESALDATFGRPPRPTGVGVTSGPLSLVLG